MTFVLYRKLLRDVRVPLVVVCLLLAAFGGLWVRVTAQVTTQISPFLSLLAMKSGFAPTFVMDMFLQGPGRLIQTFFGGESLKFFDPQETLSIAPMTSEVRVAGPSGRSAQCWRALVSLSFRALSISALRNWVSGVVSSG